MVSNRLEGVAAAGFLRWSSNVWLIADPGGHSAQWWHYRVRQDLQEYVRVLVMEVPLVTVSGAPVSEAEMGWMHDTWGLE